MRVDGKFRLMVIVGILGAGAGIAVLAHGHSSVQQDRTAIEQLHQLDVETTLSDKADELASCGMSTRFESSQMSPRRSERQ